jgi:hypothetical protein
MKKLSLLVLTLAAACGPRGYYVANVFSVNGQLVQEKCEINGNGRAQPELCHTEPVAAAQPVYPQGQQPPYPQASQQPGYAPAPAPASPGVPAVPAEPQPQPGY